MRLIGLLAGLVLATTSATAQNAADDTFDTDLGAMTIETLDPDPQGGLSLEELQRLPEGALQPEMRDITTEIQEQVAQGAGARLRALDKLTGEVGDLDVDTGMSVAFGRMTVTLKECRYPQDTPTSNAYAYLVIDALGTDVPVFEGWMIASAPALNALDHPRYDVWVLSCKTS